jgi:hypothetical protein
MASLFQGHAWMPACAGMTGEVWSVTLAQARTGAEPAARCAPVGAA